MEHRLVMRGHRDRHQRRSENKDEKTLITVKLVIQCSIVDHINKPMASIRLAPQCSPEGALSLSVTL